MQPDGFPGLVPLLYNLQGPPEVRQAGEERTRHIRQWGEKFLVDDISDQHCPRKRHEELPGDDRPQRRGGVNLDVSHDQYERRVQDQMLESVGKMICSFSRGITPKAIND